MNKGFKFVMNGSPYIISSWNYPEKERGILCALDKKQMNRNETEQNRIVDAIPPEVGMIKRYIPLMPASRFYKNYKELNPQKQPIF